MQCVECGKPIEAVVEQLDSVHCFECVLALAEPEQGVAVPSKPPKRMEIKAPPGMTAAERDVWALQQPHVLGALMAYRYAGERLAPNNPSAVVDALEQQQKAILQSDNLEGAQELLATQIQLLNMVFTHSMQKAVEQTDSKLISVYSSMGLKAQSRCRMAIEALHNLRNPAPQVVKQTNIANGPQQVNNGVTHEQSETELSRTILNGAKDTPGKGAGKPEQREVRPIHCRGNSRKKRSS